MINIFISYSHKDEEWKKKVVEHLTILQRQCLAKIWDDGKIRVGDDWNPEIEKALDTADVAVFLISNNFLISEFIRNTEVPRLLERKRQENIRLIPLLVSPCCWQAEPWLTELQHHPKGERCLSQEPDHQVDSDLASFAMAIRAMALAGPPSEMESRNEKVRNVPGPGGLDKAGRCYYFEIKKSDAGFQGVFHHGQALNRRPFNVKLDKDAIVDIPGAKRGLEDLAKAFIHYARFGNDDIFSREVQSAAGEYLYKEIFGDIHPAELKGDPDDRVELRIMAEDEHIMGLPWSILAYGGVFLMTSGWRISMASTTRLMNCKLTESPKIVIIAPEPAGMEKTRADSHLEDLEFRLSAHNQRFSTGYNIKVVASWEHFRDALYTFQPQIIYFYGHHVQRENRTCLVFSTPGAQKPEEHSLEAFAKCLHDVGDPPRMVYLNFSAGSMKGALDASRYLGGFIPVIITNHHDTDIEIAQSQALKFWTRVLLDGQPPNVATAAIPGGLAEIDRKFADARWLTPMVHCQYRNWEYKPPRRENPLVHDPHWRLNLDRLAQFGSIFLQTKAVLRSQRPPMLVYLWYGREGQGVELFHQRIKVEFQNEFKNRSQFKEIRPDWPLELDNPRRSFQDMMREAFEVPLFNDIPSKIRSYTKGASDRQALIYIRHEPLRSKILFNPTNLKKYLDWLNKEFTSLFKRGRHALAAISFIDDNPAKFKKSFIEEEDLDDVAFSNIVFRHLDEMKRLRQGDLSDFLQTNNIRLPKGATKRVLAEILDRTKGHYEQTIEELNRLVKRALDLPEDEYE